MPFIFKIIKSLYCIAYTFYFVLFLKLYKGIQVFVLYVSSP